MISLQNRFSYAVIYHRIQIEHIHYSGQWPILYDDWRGTLDSNVQQSGICGNLHLPNFFGL